MDGHPPKKGRKLTVPNVLDVDGFLIDVKVCLGDEAELNRVTDSYSIAAVEKIARMLKVVPREDNESN